MGRLVKMENGIVSCPPGQHFNGTECVPNREIKTPNTPVSVPAGWQPQVDKEARTAAALKNVERQKKKTWRKIWKETRVP